MDEMVGQSYEIRVKIDAMFLQGRFSEVDSMLRILNLQELTNTQSVSYLSVSRHAKDKLPYRQEFYEKVEEVLIAGGRDTKPLLQGLE